LNFFSLVHSLLGLFGDGADVQLTHELEVYYNLHCLKSVELQVVLMATGHQMVNLPPALTTDSSPPEMSPMRVVSSTNFRSLTELQKNRGERT